MSNPVTQIYKGVKIRKYNLLVLRLDETNFKNLIDLSEETKLSPRAIIGYSSKPCECCKDTFITVKINGEEKQIPRGLLSKGIPNYVKHKSNEQRNEKH